MSPKLPPLIHPHPKYPRYGIADVFEQGKQGLSQLFNPEGKKTKTKSIKPK
ncbi:hypothetical protein LCGC14_2296730 [marine sediment metagenome]|uniref:Uncharacterized protein n=1 Tax=marine sediment metagenome TaxID=412755 RepID=A0A0F9DCA2_9ZZZZ